jgi:transcriptional regulator with XRE-family HTH domain
MLKISIKRDNVEKALMRKNYTRKFLADKLGVSRNYLSSVFTGKREPSPMIRQRLMDLLKGYKFDDLFVITEDNNDAVQLSVNILGTTCQNSDQVDC